MASVLPASPSPGNSRSFADRALVCPSCGTVHRVATLAPGERASCIECGTMLAQGSRFGVDTALAFAVTGLIVAVPAMALPFVTVSKLSAERVGVLLSGVGALWGDGMRLLSVWVLVCGALGPLLLLSVLVALLAPMRFGWRSVAPRPLTAVAHAIEHWSMPEVHVLAVLVALVKLHTIVGVEIGWGFWCYIAMSFLTLLAWRSFDLAASVTRLQLPSSA